MKKFLGISFVLSLFVPYGFSLTQESSNSRPGFTTVLVADRIPEPTTTTTLAVTTTSTSTKVSVTSTTTTTYTSPVVSITNQNDVWDDLAQCESNGNWAARGRYEGGLQFDPYTWDAYVANGKPYGLGFPDAAYKASREQQIQVAIRVRDGVKGSSDPYLNAQGWNAWPNCRYEAGV